MPAAPTTPPPLPPPGPLAAIDIGSNSFRLEIGQVLHGRYRRIDYLKETVRLGGGLDASGALTDAAAERGLDCLRRFAQRIAALPPEHVRAVATQTLREATNRDAFLERACAALGRPIEIISGREEARLTFTGVARLQPSEQPRLVVDIGGRSTELIIGHRRQALTVESFGIGSVGLSMRYFPDGRFTADAFRAAQVAAGAELEEAQANFARSRWHEALGSSGTVGAVADVLAASGQGDGTITPQGLRWCIEQCLAAGHVDKLALPGLKDERRAVIGGGLAILYTLAMQFGIDALVPTRGALRQGVILELDDRLDALRRQRGGDLRDHSVRELQRRFGVDAAHARRVRTLALQLHGGAAADPAARELGWAAALHEIGMMVSHHDHHRHSAYLLAHVDAPGFSQSEQRRLAQLVLGQRGGLGKVAASLADEAFAWQLLCLRVAIIACHGRAPVGAQALSLHRDGRTATLRLQPGWAAEHPRTLHLLGAERDAWSGSGALALALLS